MNIDILINFNSNQNWILIQMRSNRSHLEPIIDELCSKIHCQEFQTELEKLGLGPGSDNPSSSDKVDSTSQSNQVFTELVLRNLFLIEYNFSLLLTFQKHLNSYFKPRSAFSNRFCKRLSKMYESKDLSDISLEIKDEDTQKVKVIRIHSVIVSSRCMWFQRALSSGMQEAINK